MKYQIDQSGKIEKTNKNTILCLSNDIWQAVVIEAKTKRQLQEIFRRHGQSRNFVLFTFCAGLAVLLERCSDQIYDVLIDKEYPGKESVIKNILLEMLDGQNKKPNIYFGLIGKKSMAHHRAYAVATGKLKIFHIVKLDKILAKIKNTEVGKRLKDA